MATFYQEYAASSNLTVTNLHSLAASSTYISGWFSGTIDNTTTKYDTIAVSAKFVMTSANNQAGELRVYVIPMLDDSNWPAGIVASGTLGTEGAGGIVDTEQLASALVLLWSTAVDTGTGETHSMPQTSIKDAFGFQPAKCCLFITGNGATSTNAQLAASGNQVTIKGMYNTVS